MSNSTLNVIPANARIQEKINARLTYGVKKFWLLYFFFLIASIPLAASWQFPFWNKAETQSQQQQQKWLREQQRWNQQSDPRVIERRMRDEHQKWERELKKKKQKTFLKFFQPTTASL